MSEPVLKTVKASFKRGVTKAFYEEAQEKDERVLKTKLITDLFDLNRIMKGENFAVKSFKDSYYVGEVNLALNQRDGFGVCIYENKRHYEGSWRDDKRDGKGYELFSNGNVYIGDYTNGKVNGKGLYKWMNGDTYDGEWKDGQKHGYGVWKNT